MNEIYDNKLVKDVFTKKINKRILPNIFPDTHKRIGNKNNENS